MSRVDLGAWLVWGFAATVVLTTILSAAQGLRFTRMSLPFLLGTVATRKRERANVVGFLVHLLNGWIVAGVYVAIFHAAGEAGWWRGAILGTVHAAFVLTALMKVLPGFHPRMAGEHSGPDVTRQLEPPGFLALNYGVATPLWVLVAHVIYGIILGSFYRVPA